MATVRSVIIATAALVTSVAAGEQKTAPHHAIACKDMSVVLQLADMMVRNDYASFKAYAEDQIRAGECKRIYRGQLLTVEKTDGAASCLSLVRGQPCFWAGMQFN